VTTAARYQFSLSDYNRWWHQAETQRLRQRELTPLELAEEIERYERLIALDMLDLEERDFTDDQEWSILWRVVTNEAKLEALERQARRLICIEAAPGRALNADFERSRYVDLVPLIETVTATPARKAGDRHVIACPFHEDWEPSLVIYPPGRGWHCFQCHRGGQDAASFCAEYFACSQLEGLALVEQLCDIVGAA
jgi:hypothetical protein